MLPLSQLRSTFPVLKNPANRHRAVGLTPEQWHYAFTNTFTEERVPGALRALRDPGLGRIFWARAGQLHARPAGRRVDYHNDERAPLLFISGSEDHLMPPSVQRSNAKHYKSNASPSTRSTRARPPAAGAGGLAGRSPTTPSVGAQPCPRRAGGGHWGQ